MANIPIRMTTKKVEPSVNGTVVVRDKIPKIREAIQTLANDIGSHIESVGSDAHVIGDTTQPGFMSPDLYDFLVGFQDKINELQDAINLAALPEGSILYWAGSDNSIPAGFKLCNGANGTPDNRDRFILGSANDSDVGEVGGQQLLDLSNIPLPRHTHTFNNYCHCEYYTELASAVSSSPGTSVRNTGGGWLGSNSDSNGSTYPLYYKDTTNSTGSVTSESKSNVNLEPSYFTLKTIIKSKDEPQYAADAVGTIHVSFAKNIPAGCLELNGQQVDATAYSALYNYARLNSLIIDNAKYTSILNEYGSAPYFAFNEETNLLKIPTIKSVIAGSALSATKYNAPTVQLEHYHGLGKMRNNNGYWGRRSYSGATYPSDTTAWFWNGSGGLGSGTSSMETSGDVIVSYPIHVGATGNGEACDSLNVVCSIRAYHPGAVDLSTTMTLAEDDPETLSLTAATAMSVLTEDETVVSDYESIADDSGWLRETDGLQEVWGHTEAGDSATLTISYPLSFNNEIFYIDVHNQNGSKSNVTVVDFSLTSATLNLGANFEPTDIIEYRILGY